MKSIRIIDGLTGEIVTQAKNNKQAKQIVFAYERTDRLSGDYMPNRYIILLGQCRKTDRLNKQARRAFETQEV